MRKINLLLFVIAFIAISCSGDSPTGPTMGVKGFYSIHIYSVPYDVENQSWDDANKIQDDRARVNGAISVRRAGYYNCFGVNWNKCGPYEFLGAILEYYYKNGDSSIYKYDKDNFLIEVTYYKNGVWDGNRVFLNDKGKLISENYYSDSTSSTKTYEYGENGYIKNEIFIGSNHEFDNRREYHHDSNGYVVERWYYFPESTSTPQKSIYIYNNQGLLIRRENEDGYINTEYKYNSLGLMSEKIYGDRKEEYKYNKHGMLIESIRFKDGIPNRKTVYEYDL